MASIDPQTLAITEYKLPESVRPRRLAIAADDTVYFTDFKSGHLGTLNTATGAVKLYSSPGGAESNPYGIAITPDGMVWYSESGVQPNTIVQFDPKAQKFAAPTFLRAAAWSATWLLLLTAASTLPAAASTKSAS